MIRPDLDKTDIAYLLGAVGIALRLDRLPDRDRKVLIDLRDRLAAHLELDDDVARALGLLSRDELQ